MKMKFKITTKLRRDEGSRRKSIGVLRVSSFLRFFVVILFSASGYADDFLQVTSPREFSFPRDHGRHDGYKTEWWYFTGNLQEKGTGRRFGYQLTFFRTAMTPEPTTRPSPWAIQNLYFSHAAVSDLAGQKFLFKDRLQRGRPGLAEASDRTMDVALLDSSAKLDEKGLIHLLAKEEGFAIDLTCAPGRGPILQGPGGVNAKGTKVGQASYYYSLTRLPTTGTLTVNGKRFDIEGRSWMDHEFSSNALANEQAGWDWLGLTLDNGSDLMIYRLRRRDGSADYLSGTRVTSDGQAHYLNAGDIHLEGSHPWTSPTTGGVYPQEWTLTARGEPPMTIRSLMPNQELITTASTDVNYFEGAAEVLIAGKPSGEGYLEITGTAKPLTDGGMAGK